MLCTPERHFGLLSPSAKNAYISAAGRLTVTSFSAWATLVPLGEGRIGDGEVWHRTARRRLAPAYGVSWRIPAYLPLWGGPDGDDCCVRAISRLRADVDFLDFKACGDEVLSHGVLGPVVRGRDRVREWFPGWPIEEAEKGLCPAGDKPPILLMGCASRPEQRCIFRRTISVSVLNPYVRHHATHRSIPEKLMRPRRA
jgi:hypothetical protein